MAGRVGPGGFLPGDVSGYFAFDMESDGVPAMLSLYSSTKAGEDQHLGSDEDKIKNWNWEREENKRIKKEERRRKEREEMKERKKKMEQRVRARDAFEKERREREEREKETKRWKQANIKKARDALKKARLEQDQLLESDPRVVLEKERIEKQARDEADANAALERALRHKLSKAMKDVEKREEKAKKEAENRCLLEALLAEEEEQDQVALGVAMAGNGDDGWDPNGPYDWSTITSEEGTEPKKSKDRITQVIWDHVPGSCWMKGFQFVGERRVEVVRPRFSTWKPTGANCG